ncbi:hypothetical protein Pcaca03_07070 [Pectobacterium carotovorum subsp. carotovorum]|uniref:Uncharacterized protein n=1 Tax=Pectobacterium carotovorum subsp. carotovorum TaxID=555 RepID=A0AAI9KY14_PECCC|nr:hypothetical protein SOASR016_07090 [Pectobacterium carotovorum subsp. carotovorum]GLV68263.1 hypothetical protein Pcaca03_07070 [Pectobacterium carotovorum subsp. carotovorum]
MTERSQRTCNLKYDEYTHAYRVNGFDAHRYGCLSDFRSLFCLSKADIQRNYADTSRNQNELPTSAKKMLHNSPNMV